MKTILRIAMCLVAVMAGSAAGQTVTEATEALGSAYEDEANKVMWSIKPPQETPESVQQKVADFMEKYPGSRRRREVRSRPVETYVLTGRTADAVEECMRQGFDLPGSQLGDQVVGDSWLAMASLFAKQGRLDAAAHIRVRTYLTFPYQIAYQRQLITAVGELSKMGKHDEVLAVGRMALALLSEADSGKVLAAVKLSLAAVRGKEAAETFEAYWQEGPGKAGSPDPLADVGVAEREQAKKAAEADLGVKALMLDKADALASQRGMLRLLAGDFPKAAEEFQLSVASAPPDWKNGMADRAGAYFRWLDGSTVRARQYRAYVKFGKAGPDGTVGTADDLVNPFTEVVGAK